MSKRKKTNITFFIVIALCTISIVGYFFIYKKIIVIKKHPVVIPEIVQWNGVDPYPGVDWSHTVPELRSTVNAFEDALGTRISILQVYRPTAYTKHIRSVWEVWRYVQGKSYTGGYGCSGYAHINPKNIGTLSVEQKSLLAKEARVHGISAGSVPPACRSDHSLGFAVDIVPPTDHLEYLAWMNTAYSVGLCHYIEGDEPHFGLTAYLPAGTECLVP